MKRFAFAKQAFKENEKTNHSLGESICKNVYLVKKKKKLSRIYIFKKLSDKSIIR